MKRHLPSADSLPDRDSERVGERELSARLGRWLSAESEIPAIRGDFADDELADGNFEGGQLGAAESALFELFEALPDPIPTAGFADRVLAASGLAVEPRVVEMTARDLGRRARFLTAMVCGLVASAVLVMVPLLLTLVFHLEPAALLASFAQAFGMAVRGLVDLLRLGQALSGLGRAAFLVATSPQVLAILCLLGLSTLGLGRGLLHLLQSERTLSDVRAH